MLQQVEQLTVNVPDYGNWVGHVDYVGLILFHKSIRYLRPLRNFGLFFR